MSLPKLLSENEIKIDDSIETKERPKQTIIITIDDPEKNIFEKKLEIQCQQFVLKYSNNSPVELVIDSSAAKLLLEALKGIPYSDDAVQSEINDTKFSAPEFASINTVNEYPSAYNCSSDLSRVGLMPLQNDETKNDMVHVKIEETISLNPTQVSLGSPARELDQSCLKYWGSEVMEPKDENTTGEVGGILEAPEEPSLSDLYAEFREREQSALALVRRHEQRPVENDATTPYGRWHHTANWAHVYVMPLSDHLHPELATPPQTGNAVAVPVPSESVASGSTNTDMTLQDDAGHAENVYCTRSSRARKTQKRHLNDTNTLLAEDDGSTAAVPVLSDWVTCGSNTETTFQDYAGHAENVYYTRSSRARRDREDLKILRTRSSKRKCRK